MAPRKSKIAERAARRDAAIESNRDLFFKLDSLYATGYEERMKIVGALARYQGVPNLLEQISEQIMYSEIEEIAKTDAERKAIINGVLDLLRDEMQSIGKSLNFDYGAGLEQFALTAGTFSRILELLELKPPAKDWKEM